MIFVFLILVAIRVTWIIAGLPLSLPELKWLLVGERLSDGFTMYKDLYDHTGPLAALVYKWLDFVFGRSRWVHLVVSTFLVTVQAGIFNRILLKNKAYDENSYVPAFLYVVLMSSVMDFFALSPQLMAITFILLSLNHIFRRIDNVVTDELFLLSGIYLGVATCFYLPAAVFFVIFLLSFILFSSAVPRRLLLLVYGAGVVFVVIWAYFFWFGAGRDFLDDFFVEGVSKARIFYVSFMELLGIGGFLLGVTLLSLTVLFSLRVTNYQQKMQQVMVSFMLAAFLVVLFSRDLMSADLIFFVPTTTFFLVHYFLGLRRKVWKVLMPYLMVIGLLVYPNVWLRNNPPSGLLVKPSEVKVPGNRLMGLGLDVADYQEYVLAGPFLDAEVSRKKMEDLHYYDEASGLFETLEQSAPDAIIDQWGDMAQIFERFPVFSAHYQETSPGVYLRVD